jgi:signal transduction histidine kinase
MMQIDDELSVHRSLAQRIIMRGHSRRIRATSALAVFLTASLFCPAGFAAESKRVMLLHSFGRDFKPWSEYAKAIRMELDRQSPWPLDITENSLVTARFSDEDPEGPFVDYLRALFAKRPLDLIVSIGAPAANFVQRHRQRLFAGTPMVLMAVDERRVQYSNLTANDTAVAVRINYLSVFENILQVLPDTKDVVVVVGTSPIEKFWKEAIAKEVEPLANRIKLSWTDELSFESLLKQASTLPPHTAIFWELMIVDAVGVVHEGDVPLTRLHAVANAPIFSYDESFFGSAIVGGPLLLVADSSRQTAAVAVRILGGEKPGEIKTPPVQFAGPVFDWREMRRWGISESRLPAGSEIRFRPATAWEQYRWQVLIIAAVILTQTLLIMGLVYEHQRRRRAEVQSMQRMTELAHLNRVATAGELSASIAHEVKQPLAAVVAQSSAALRWLAHATPDLDEARAALKKITFAGNRASEIVDNLRSMFRKESGARRPLDINGLITNVIGLTSHEAQKHDILVHTTFLDAPKPQTLGDQAQLEQVFLNLVMNAIEAMNSSKSDHRVLELKTSVNEGHEVLVTVADSGPGVDAENLEKIFDAFFTTKPDGMGMGLSICRSIIESHGGRLWALPGDPGLIFCVSLPSVGR